MEYLLTLVKQHRTEVEQALQFDPTLKAEIEFDLRHYERVRKENATTLKKNTVPSAATAEPALSTVKRPVLKSARKSAQQETKNKGTTVRFSDAGVAAMAMDEGEDPMLRVLSQPLPDDVMITNENVPSGLGNILDAGNLNGLASASKHSAQKRRSWGVVVSALQPEENEAETSNGKKMLKDVHGEASGSSPVKKRSRRSKSRSPPAFLALQQQLQQVKLQAPPQLGLEYSEEDALEVKKLDTLFEAAAAAAPSAVAGGKRSSKVQSVSLLAMK